MHVEKWLAANKLQLKDDAIILNIWNACSALGGYLTERGTAADFTEILRLKRAALKAAGEFRDRFC